MALMITTQLINIVKDCRELFLEGYHADKNVKYKGTVDLVTEYDVAVEKRLTKSLKKSVSRFHGRR